MKIQLGSCLVFLVAECVAAPAIQWPVFNTEGCHPEYAKYLTKAQAAMSKSLYQTAVEAFKLALQSACFEVPNYELTGPLAEAQCQSGHKKLGQESLKDFACMLAVDSGKQSCYTETTTELKRSPGLTDRCFEAMCGELYLNYYEHPTEMTLTRVKFMTQKTTEVSALCK